MAYSTPLLVTIDGVPQPITPPPTTRGQAARFGGYATMDSQRWSDPRLLDVHGALDALPELPVAAALPTSAAATQQASSPDARKTSAATPQQQALPNCEIHK